MTRKKRKAGNTMLQKETKIKCNYNLSEKTVSMLNELHRDTKIARGTIIDELVKQYYKTYRKDGSSKVAE